MNTKYPIKISTTDLAKAQVEFQTKVMKTAGCNRFEFQNRKGYAFSNGNPKPQIFVMVRA